MLCGVLRLIILATLFIFLINITIKYVMISKKQASQLPHVKNFPILPNISELQCHRNEDKSINQKAYLIPVLS